MAKSVAVIGAGTAGLAVVKTCIEHGLKPTCFEQRHDIGGLWLVENPKQANLQLETRVYEGMLQNVVKHFFAYSDFPHKPEDPYILPAELAKDYLESYAEKFQLKTHIRLNTKVKVVEKAQDYATTGRWRVEYSHAITGEGTESEIFDAVIVCSGYFSKANWPSIPDQSNFEGSIIHSGQFWNAQPYEGCSVAVVGSGISGLDLASVLAPRVKQVHLISRHGCDLIPLFLEPAKSWEEQMNSYKLNSSGSLDKIRKAWYRSMAKKFDTESLGLKADYLLFSGTASISNDIDKWIYADKVRVVRGEVEKFLPDGLEMSDGEKVEVEHVIFSTGYTCATPFIKDSNIFPENASEQEWWEYIYPVKQEHPTLFTVGLMYSFGAYPCTVEMQARAVCGILDGTLLLPSKDDMKTWIEAEKEAQLAVRGTFPGTVNQFPYTMELSKFVGCYPSLLSIAKKSPKLAYKLWSGYLMAAHFRLLGRHSNYKLAKSTLLARKKPEPRANAHHKPHPIRKEELHNVTELERELTENELHGMDDTKEDEEEVPPANGGYDNPTVAKDD